jgi:hypothetical protein
MAEQFWLNDVQWEVIEPLLPHLGGKPPVDDRRVISGIEKGFGGARSIWPALQKLLPWAKGRRRRCSQ